MPYAVWHGLAADESSSDLVVLASPDVTVTDKSDGSTPQVYADRDGNTALGNPFTANADGSITFYAPPGRYKIEATDGTNTAAWDNELIGVPHGMDSRTDQAVPKYVSANNQFEPVLVGTAATSIPTNAQIGAYVPSITDSGTDAYTVSAGRAIGTDETFTGNVNSPNGTTTPTMENTDGSDGALTVTTRDGSALWAGALDGWHRFQKAASSWLVLDPNPSQERDLSRAATDSARGDVKLLDEDDFSSDSADHVPTQQSAKAYTDDRVDSRVYANDATLTWHEASVQSVSGESYETVLDLSGAHAIEPGGLIMAQQPGVRVTVDGVVKVDRTASISGRDSNGNPFGVVGVPVYKSSTSLKVEAYNTAGSAKDTGWRVATRAL